MKNVGCLQRHNRQAPSVGTRAQCGFSMIEVLIAVLVLALGLLGFALLQTMNLRYAQSANHRTLATNLAYDLLDQIRANRVLADQYTQINPASFASITGNNCTRPVTYVTPAASAERWKCQVRAALGGDATATVARTPAGMTVTINWADARGDVGQVTDGKYGSVTVGTQL